MPTLVEPETGRLRLRQWQLADREPFARLNADPRVMACFPAPLERAASDALAERCAALIGERGWGFWAVDLKKTGKFIGFVGLHVPSADLPFAPCVEIGWRLAHEYWGQGLASEAARAALQVGFTTLALPEIVAFTARSNLRSQAVMVRIGMRDAGTPFAHPAVPVGHPLREHVLYRLPRERWASQEKEAVDVGGDLPCPGAGA